MATIEANEAKASTRIVRKAKTELLTRIKADTCVIGAGMAGISAALEAAKLGHRVVLIDGLPDLGGQAVNSRIGVFCGLFSNGRKPYQFTHGMADGMLQELKSKDALFPLNSGLGSVVYDDLVLSRYLEKTVFAAGITVVLGGILRKVHCEDRRIKSVEVTTRYGDVQIVATGFVDATGDAALAWFAGLPCQESAEGHIFGSHMVVLEGIDIKHLPAHKDFVARQKEKAEEYGLTRTDGLVFNLPSKDIAFVNMTHDITPLDPLAATHEALAGKARVDAGINFLKSEYPLAFGKARIRAYGLSGIRQTRWLVGCKQLTAHDVAAGIYFDDAIARTAWPMELHNKSEGYSWNIFSDDHVHYIPFGSLISPDADNLVAAGRCISADVDALSSVRVIGPCIATGAAAAHALDLAQNGSIHEINIAALKERVKDNLVRID